MGNRNDMNIIKFIESFPDENSCRQHFRKVRNNDGESQTPNPKMVHGNGFYEFQ